MNYLQHGLTLTKQGEASRITLLLSANKFSEMFKSLFGLGQTSAPVERTRNSRLDSVPQSSQFDSRLDSIRGGNSQFGNSQFVDSKLDGGGAPVNGKTQPPILEKVDQRKRMALRPPSFTDLLPWTRFDPDEKIFILKDGSSLGLMFEMSTVATEAQPMSYLRDRAHKVQESLQALPESSTSPWVLQFFLNDDLSMEGSKDAFREYIKEVHSSNQASGRGTELGVHTSLHQGTQQALG